jgi:hypothetical protein
MGEKKKYYTKKTRENRIKRTENFILFFFLFFFLCPPARKVQQAQQHYITMQYSEPNTQNLISLIQDANTLLCTLQTYITTVSSRVHQLHNNYAMDKISSMCNHLREVVDFLEIETIQFSVSSISLSFLSFLSLFLLLYNSFYS